MHLRKPKLLLRKFRALRRRHWRETLWLGPAFCLLGIMRAILLLVPFGNIARYLGRHLENVGVIPLAGAQQVMRAEHIGSAIRTAANYTPWESKCLAQAMTARVILGINGIPYALFLGINKQNPTEMKAHAWVRVDRVPVTGGDGFAEFTVVSTFVAADTFAGQAF
ncbi:lasso peptide biosynthesis B2 protein [Methylomonas sp. SURF-2]|uniref:Lasso peptide biosynthesis B2 protein n=1 Tax=Methylomonas subterranea TaxID=2952225 RepID=A0ABT1TII8_9GAMM|nr:lasso peptide biosynthesis B2 protein [Methylomonas sp. SURF-2]MCQ8105048.1 lasso peptide biosynthesis B2 protein [Methylomonas sp. SURF-2]